MGAYNAIIWKKIVLIFIDSTKILLTFTGNICQCSKCDNVKKMVLTVGGSVI